MSPLTRRQLLVGTATAAVGAAAARAAASSDTLAHSYVPTGQLPNPANSGLDHIVVLCMENRSFDHYLGWLLGADGKQAGLSYVLCTWQC